MRLLEDAARRLAAVDRGIAVVGRGEFVDEEAMDALVERLVRT
jgi:predicted transcriptional regulator